MLERLGTQNINVLTKCKVFAQIFFYISFQWKECWQKDIPLCYILLIARGLSSTFAQAKNASFIKQ